MKKSSKMLMPDISDTRRVKVFIKRVYIAFISLILFVIIAIPPLVYLPLNKALKESLIDNFDQISIAIYRSFQNDVQRALEGAKSLSSRTMIKQAMVEYKNGDISLADLKDYTQPKYEDGANALDYLYVANRYAENELIAEYTLCKDDETKCLFSLLKESKDIDSKLCLDGECIHLVIRSPITFDIEILGYDQLIFDLTKRVEALSTDSIEVLLLNHDNFYDMISDAEKIRSYDDTVLYYGGNTYFHAVQLEDNNYFISKQSKDTLLSAIHLLSIKIFAAGVGLLLFFIAAIYLYVIKFAKKELAFLETSHDTLEEVALLANIDPLTEIGGRRYAETALSIYFSKYIKGESSPAIVLFDVDSFKYINDNYGHFAGDMMLRKIADTVKAVTGENMLFRWGGDEYVAILHAANENELESSINDILKSLFKAQIKINEDIVITPTVSLGISYFRPEDGNYIEAVNRADIAMYKSKTKGGNRYTVN